MSTDMRVTPTNTKDSLEASTKPIQVSLQPAFFALESLFHPAKNYDYPFLGGETARIKPDGFTKEVFEGFLFFLSELPVQTFQKHFLSFEQSVTSLGAGMPDSVWRNVPAKACEDMARAKPDITIEDLGTAIRRTLRDVNTTLYTPHTTLPGKVQGQLLAVLIFIKSMPKVPEKISQEADTLYQHILAMEETKNSDPIFFHVRDNLNPHFLKEGSWTKSYNEWFGGWWGYKI